MTEDTIGGSAISSDRIGRQSPALRRGVPSVSWKFRLPFAKKWTDLVLLLRIARRLRFRQLPVELKTAVAAVTHFFRPLQNGLRPHQQSPAGAQAPAFATALNNDGGQARAIGASRIGKRSPNRSQKV